MRTQAFKTDQGLFLIIRMISASLLIVGALLSTQARATLTIDAAVGGAATGMSYSNFNNLTLGNAGGLSNGITITFSGDAAAVQGAASGLYAAPVLSNNNGAPFGDTNGTDTSTYLSTGIGSVTMMFSTTMQYFGLLWGSVDGYNSLYFYDGATLIGSVSGSDVWAGANGDQGASGTFFVNINSSLGFDRVVATSGGYAFEFDNVAYSAPAAVPEPATILMFGLLAGLGLFHRLVRQNPTA